MKYHYYVEYSDFGSPILRLPEEIGLVTAFLFSDVQGPLGRSIFLEQINRVLKGEIPSSEVGGNMCVLEIEKDFTTIINALTDDEDNLDNRCIIETEELKNLILVWLSLRQLASKQRDTDTIYRVPASATDQSAMSNELPTDAWS